MLHKFNVKITKIPFCIKIQNEEKGSYKKVEYNVFVLFLQENKRN